MTPHLLNHVNFPGKLPRYISYVENFISVCTLFGCLPSWSSSDLSSPFLFLPLLLDGSSFSSMSVRNLWKRPEIELALEAGSEGGDCHNWNISCIKCKTRAIKQAIPQMRKRPQKLLSWRRSESISAFSKLQELRVIHLSWIRCRSPVSESCRMAVDMSTAKGESLGKA